jgi:hypothetical protein
MRRSFLLYSCTSAVCLACLLLASAGAPVKADEMTSSLLVGQSRIDVEIQGGESNASKAPLLDWVRNAAESVVAYYGRFPVPHLSLRIVLFAGHGVRHGRTFGEPSGGRIIISAGDSTSPEEFASDWMLTHEMVHLAFPSVAEEHHWIEEGISTYVEPIARVQAGHLQVAEMWRDLVRDLPQGLPRPGDQGLDHTHTWGRTYWGGALFCFLADVEIRERTKNRKGLQDALRGILDAGGDIRRDWDLKKAFKAGDRAAGVNVLAALYDKMKDRPMDVDLPKMWEQLGIQVSGGQISFDNKAPLAATCKAICAGERVSPSAQAVKSKTLVVFAGRKAT